MAKAKSSAQEDLSASKTGIDLTAGLGFINKSENKPEDKPAEIIKEKIDEVPKEKEESVDKKVVTTNSSTVEVKVKQKSPAKKGSEKNSKLVKPENPDKVSETHKISALISTEAKENLEKYAKIYGYKKISPFINDLFEHLDAYLDD